MPKTKNYQKALCWVRRDLRLTDQTALAQACLQSESVAVVFIFDRVILDKLEDKDDKRLTFIYQSLEEMDARLRELGSSLILRYGDPVEEIPKLVMSWGAEAVFTNIDYEPYAYLRDGALLDQLGKMGKALRLYKDQVIFEKREIVTAGGTPFRVFTPYKNAWLKKFKEDPSVAKERVVDLKALAPAQSLKAVQENWPLEKMGFKPAPLWLKAGASGAQEKLKTFTSLLSKYHETRDYPAITGTSGLSVHLRFGTLSVRELVRKASASTSQGAQTWLSELIWRDFYQMILDQFPRVAERAFRPEFEDIQWPGREKDYEAWTLGLTGFPIVDAAMRQLNETGWMHNRLRMIVASFLVKDCLIDYRRGEAYFARKLLDFDLSANNGGWQWAASTGCDAQPYFRIFNPVLQSERFDGEGKFLRIQCPELAGFSNKLIHWPSAASLAEQKAAKCLLGKDYPKPIVDHAAQKEKVLGLFKSKSKGTA